MKSMVNYISPVILAPAESAMPWDLFIYKATLLAVVDLQYIHCHIIATVISSLIVHLYIYA